MRGSAEKRPTARRDTAELLDLGRCIVAWGTEGGSTSRRPELPWRSTRDPWAVLVSEVMAQQTQVGRVVPVYRRFLIEFPNPAACADASLGEVLRAWQGLGYNRRARNLHRAAAAIVADYGGKVPGTLPSLLSLPGVGAYTARAVLAFSFEADVGVVDTNAGRVLSRGVSGHSIRPSEAQSLVDAMVPPGEAWIFGQALLDLGASVCTASAPRCQQCPIVADCRWAMSGRPSPDPAVGSAGVSTRQSAFVGSDRQGRGRLISVLRDGDIAPAHLAEAAGWPDDPDRAERVALGLIGEGLVVRDGTGTLSLP
jgi:A/G-specific adenine glycosylase